MVFFQMFSVLYLHLMVSIQSLALCSYGIHFRGDRMHKQSTKHNGFVEMVWFSFILGRFKTMPPNPQRTIRSINGFILLNFGWKLFENFFDTQYFSPDLSLEVFMSVLVGGWLSRANHLILASELWCDITQEIYWVRFNLLWLTVQELWYIMSRFILI